MPTSDELKKAGEAIRELADVAKTFGGVLITASDLLRASDELERQEIRKHQTDILKSKRFWLGLTNSEARRLMELENWIV